MDYEKLHKDTITKLQEMVNSGKITVEIARGICADFIPENEDERIRKWLIGVLSTYEHDKNLRDVALAWLEKQGEHAKFLSKIQVGDKVTRNEDGKLVNLSQLKRVAKKDEKQGEQKPLQEIEPTPIFKIGDILKRKGKDYTFRIDRILGGYYHCDHNNGAFFPIEEQGDWELVEQKPAWSEEDEKNLRVVVDYLIADNGLTLKHINWLKSLKERVLP